MKLDEIARDIHLNAVEKGFWDYIYNHQDMPLDNFIFYAKQIAMIHSEGTEVLEALRKQKGEQQVVEELADIIIRVLDLYYGLLSNGEVALSLDDIMEEKLKINEKRPRLHGVLG